MNDFNKIKKITVLKPEQYTTTDELTLFEFTRVVALRAEQLRNGAPTNIDTNHMFVPQDKDINEEIAEREIFERKCPIKICRYIKDTPDHAVVEERPVNSLIPTRACYGSTEKFMKHMINKKEPLDKILSEAINNI